MKQRALSSTQLAIRFEPSNFVVASHKLVCNFRSYDVGDVLVSFTFEKHFPVMPSTSLEDAKYTDFGTLLCADLERANKPKHQRRKSTAAISPKVGRNKTW